MVTPIEMRQSKFYALLDVCTVLKNTICGGNNPEAEQIEEVRSAVNELLEEYTCTTLILNNNSEKISFGICVDPVIVDADVIKIILTSEEVSLTRYALEIDLDLFNKLDAMEIVSLIVEEVTSMLDVNNIEVVRFVLDMILAKEEKYIEIKQSVNYSQILTFGIKDVMRTNSSILSKDESAIGINKYAQGFETTDILVDIASKLRSIVFIDRDVTIEPNLGILKWSLMVYKDIDRYYHTALDNLRDSLFCTGSELLKREVNKTIKCIQRAKTEILSEASILTEAIKGLGLFNRLKMNGLKSIEDDLYEYKIRLKNCDEEEEAMYILRQVNTRISILEDYLATNNVSPTEREHWRSVIDEYREIRIELTKKKINLRKSYGVFIDYDKFDNL